MNLYDNLPWDLKACPNWVCWTYQHRGDGKPTKVPIDPKSGNPASTNNPATWASFELARQVAESHGTGLGFVFTNSPFAGVDLDGTENAENIAFHQSVVEGLQSYSERSPSGKGLHIIVRGSVPHGKKDTAKACEVYSDGRYFTMTGDVYKQLPIAERQDALTALWNQLGGSAPELPTVESRASKLSDEQVILAASRAANGGAFRKLWDGDMSAYDNDHSAADQALINMIAFYTPDHEQVARIFHRSKLGQRGKAHRGDYLARTIARSYDKGAKLDTSNVENFKARSTQALQSVQQTEEFDDFVDENLIDESLAGFELTADDNIPWPPGVVGELAAAIYGMSLYPRRRVAISSALAVMSLICGRSWHLGSMGLNLYIILLGKTGLGKSDGINGAYRTLQQLDRYRQNLDPTQQFLPKLRKEFVSKQGMHRDLVEYKSILYVIDEVQIRLASMLSAHSSSPDHGIKSFLTAAYTESGPFGVLAPAVYSKKDASLPSVDRPNLGLYGLGVPNQFWSTVNYEHLQDGFLNRLVLLECPEEENSIRNRAPEQNLSDDLLSKLVEIANTSAMGSMKGLGQSIEVHVPDNIKEIDFKNSEHYRLSGSETAKYATARVALNTMKIAALFAIGDNPIAPAISEYGYHWAHRLVSESAHRMLLKFDRGQTGSGDNKCVADLKEALRQYFNPKGKHQTTPSVKTLGEGIVTYRHIGQHCRGKAFSDHSRGAIMALELALKRVCDEGILTPIEDGRRGGRRFKLLVKWNRI